jgi:hypothetical protein
LNIDRDEIEAQLSAIAESVARLRAEVTRDALLREDSVRDHLLLGLGANAPISRDIEISTEHPIALTSDDHKFPWGTKNDNTRHPRFVAACERIFGRKVRHLDLGCAGGGLVWDFLVNGNFSVGIEGSNYSRVNQRAEWRTIPSHLFTADITEPFGLSQGGDCLRFDVITAWEVLEHIPEQRLDGLLDNIIAHLSEDGLFVASVAMTEDGDPTTGAVWHVTIKPYEWWAERLRAKGLIPQESPFDFRDYVRGSGNPRAFADWDASANPETGFHLVARRQSDASIEPVTVQTSGKRDEPGFFPLDQLACVSVLDELRRSSPSAIDEVDFGAGGRPVEVGLAADILYLPALHLQVWHDRIIPREANIDDDAFPELQENIRSGAVRVTERLNDVDEIEDQVCILSNLYSNNFFHFFEELYKVTILERNGFRGRYVLSPYGDRHYPGLPPYATEFLELLGIRDDRIVICHKPTLFRSAWFTTRFTSEETIPYSKVFFALRAALITGATTIAPGLDLGPRLYLERYPKRVVVNRDEVRECVSRYGFATVDMATLSVAQQIAAAHQAEILLGTHGSGMLHCAFLKEKSTVIECFSPQFMDFFILDYCHLLEHHYFQIVAINRTEGPLAYKYGGDVAINCHHLELVLKSVTGE